VRAIRSAEALAEVVEEVVDEGLDLGLGRSPREQTLDRLCVCVCVSFPVLTFAQLSRELRALRARTCRNVTANPSARSST
jgi:hypothetical protein